MRSRIGKSTGKDLAVSPVNNFPAYEKYDGGMTDPTTLEVFSLRRHNAELSAKVKNLNDKLSRVHEILSSLRRFFDLWINEGQGETYDQIHARMYKIKSAIDLIEDRTWGETAPLEIPERWRKDGK